MTAFVLTLLLGHYNCSNSELLNQAGAMEPRSTLHRQGRDKRDIIQL
jgi:hypothetical protein